MIFCTALQALLWVGLEFGDTAPGKDLLSGCSV